MAKILMIDNYDSFTYNLVQYLQELGHEVQVVRNDVMTVDEVCNLKPDLFVISPGPCTPNEAGISVPLIKAVAGSVPILGVCLGHQSIIQAFGGDIIRAPTVMHGKTSMVHHKGVGMFTNLPNPFQATRYHSLVGDPKTMPECLEVTAWVEDDDGKLETIMGIRHRELPIQGVQFHPESIMTDYGHQMLQNFVENP